MDSNQIQVMKEVINWKINKKNQSDFSSQKGDGKYEKVVKCYGARMRWSSKYQSKFQKGIEKTIKVGTILKING